MKNKFVVLVGTMLCLMSAYSSNVFAYDIASVVTNETELETCINAGQTCVLVNNIEVTDTITFNLDGKATIDLNNHDIYNQSSLSDIFALRRGELTITGSGRVADTSIGDSDTIFHLYGTNDHTYDKFFYDEPDLPGYTGLQIDDDVSILSNLGTGVAFDVKDKPYGMILLLNGDIEAKTGIETRMPDVLPWVADEDNYPVFPEPKIYIERGFINAHNIGIKLLSRTFLFTNYSAIYNATYNHPTIHGDNIGIYAENGCIDIRNTSINSYTGSAIEINSKNINENDLQLTILDGSDIVSAEGEHAIYEHLAPGSTDSILTWLDINNALLSSVDSPVVVSEEASAKGGVSYISSAKLSSKISEKYIYKESFQEYNEADDYYYVRDYFVEENTQEYFDEIAARLNRGIFMAFYDSLSEQDIIDNDLENQVKSINKNAVLLNAYNISAESLADWDDPTLRPEHEIPSDLPLKYRFNIPDAIYNSEDKAKTRKFHVYRIHDYGDGDVIEEISSGITEMDDGAHALRFSTDKCSYFIIAYTDEEENIIPKAPDSGIVKEEKVENCSFIIQIVLCLMIIAPAFIHFRQKYENRNK